MRFLLFVLGLALSFRPALGADEPNKNTAQPAKGNQKVDRPTTPRRVHHHHHHHAYNPCRSLTPPSYCKDDLKK